MRKYRFTILKATAKATKSSVEFKAASDELAYRYVIDEILMVPGNEPLKEGVLARWSTLETAFNPIMRWARGPGWSFVDGRTSNVEDHRPAPGA